MQNRSRLRAGREQKKKEKSDLLHVEINDLTTQELRARGYSRRMHRFRRPLTAVLLLPALGLAACGGGGDGQDAKKTIDTAFKKPIKSANVKLSAQAEVDGVPQLGKPVKFELSGPYQGNGDSKLPSFDWNIKVSGGGQDFAAGVISTGSDAFVTFGGQNYEVGRGAVSRFNRQLADSTKKTKKRSFSAFGINPTDWLKDPSDEGTDDVGGVESNHVSAAVDMGKLLNDLNSVVDKAPAGGVAGRKPAKLTKSQIKSVNDAVKDPKFDVYAGKDDGKLRKLQTDFDFQVPDGKSSQAGGLSGGKITFSLEFTDVGKPVKVGAPSNAKPIGDLTGQLGGLLGAGSLGGGSSSGGGSSYRRGGGGGTAPPPSTRGLGRSASDKALSRYKKCIQKAPNSDVNAIQKCAKLLQ